MALLALSHPASPSLLSQSHWPGLTTLSHVEGQAVHQMTYPCLNRACSVCLSFAPWAPNESCSIFLSIKEILIQFLLPVILLSKPLLYLFTFLPQVLEFSNFRKSACMHPRIWDYLEHRGKTISLNLYICFILDWEKEKWESERVEGDRSTQETMRSMLARQNNNILVVVNMTVVNSGC